MAPFDQDSTAPPTFVDTMCHAYNTNRRAYRVALLVPRYIDSRLGIPLPTIYAEDGSLQVAMTSGSLMPIAILGRKDGSRIPHSVESITNTVSVYEAKDIRLRNALKLSCCTLQQTLPSAG